MRKGWLNFMIDFNKQEKNISILLENYYHNNLSNDFFKISYDISEVIVFFQDIYNLKNELYEVDGNTKLIKSLKNFKRIAPSYIHGGGSESIGYIDFKNSGDYRHFDLDNILLNLALVYNTIVVFDDLYLELYYDPGSVFQSNSPILDYYKKEFTSDSYETFNSLIFDEKNQRNKNFSYTRFKQIKTSGSKIYTLEVDIESFFANIYTHNLENLKDTALFSNYDEIVKKYFTSLDTLIRKLNSNRTKGIIIGPLICKIASELFLLSIDYEIKQFIESSQFGISYIRYVDDYKFYSDEENELKILLNFLRKNFEKNHLNINSGKTKIHNRLMNVDTSDLDYLFQEFRYLNKQTTEVYHVKHSDIAKINSFVDNSFEIFKISQVKTFFTLFIKRLSIGRIKFNKISDELFLENLLKIGFKYPVLLSRVYRLIDFLVSGKSTLIENLKLKNKYINRWYNDTVAQIQHYYILNKYGDENSVKTSLRELIDQYRSIQELSSTPINPLVLATFIKEDNFQIQDIVIEYLDNLCSIKSGKNKIAFSKWWIIFKKIYQVNTNNRDPLNLFENADGTEAYDKLYYSKIVKI